MRFFTTILFVQLCITTIQAQQPSSFREYRQEFTTYPFSDPNPIAINSGLYPYFRYDGFTTKPVQQQWKVIELQNDYIKLLILPEIGGKIWAAFDKQKNQPFIYYNHVVKFRDVAMRGPWTSGGLEANYGIIGHTPNCATPVDYLTRQNEDGSVSCFIGVFDLVSRSNWRIEINLPKDKAYFSTRSFWYNSTEQPQPYYHWMNLGLPAKNDLEFVFPGTHYVGHNGEYADWPVDKQNGKHLNFYEQNNFGGYKSYHVIGKLANFWGAYYHQSENGMVRVGNYDDKMGRKIWIWGLSRQGMIWENILTDKDGQYVELQSGRLFNQNSAQSSYTAFKQVDFAPYATDTWQEYWYPVYNTRGITEANQYGALNTQYENGWLKIFFSAAQQINDQLDVTSNGKNIYSKKIQLAPLQTFSDSVRVTINAEDIVATLGVNKLAYNSQPVMQNLNRPLEPLAAFDWTSALGLYTEAQQLFDQKQFARATDKLEVCLKKEPAYLPALLLKAILQYRNMQYEDALQSITNCLQVNTHDGAVNYYYGLIAAKLGKIPDAIDGFSAATLTQEYKSAAFTELARIYMQQSYYDKTIHYAEKAIAYNEYNIDAWMLKAVAARKLNNTALATTVLTQIKTYDPLNHFAAYETNLLSPTETNKKAFIGSFKNELPQESYAELAIWYYNSGITAACKEVFSLCPPSAEAAYWLAFLNHQTVDCSKINPYLSFPFRPETGRVLEQLLSKQNDWLLKYQLGLLYRDKNRIEDTRKLFRDCGNEPDYAPFYIVRSQVFNADKEQVLQDIQKAVALDPQQWRYQKLLAEYFLPDQPEKALSIAAPYYKTYPDSYIMGMLTAKCLMSNQQYQQADALLSRLVVIPFEGATDGRLLYREAKLMQAVAALQHKKQTVAAKFIQQSKLWPETLGAGKPYDTDIDNRLEDWLDYLSMKDKKSSAASTLLAKIAAFNPAIDNTVPNFIASNALVSAWAIEKTNGKTAASKWLDQQLQKFPAHEKVLSWSRDAFNQQAKTGDIQTDSNIRILEAIQKM